jgi:8-oxo-dGTP pyrophosphatase MutT (NUDIX family)
MRDLEVTKGKGLSETWFVLSPEECLPLPCYGPAPSVDDLRHAGLVPWSFYSSEASQQPPLGWMHKGLAEALLSALSLTSAQKALVIPDRFYWQGLGPGLFVDGGRIDVFEQQLGLLLGSWGWRNEDFAVRDRAGVWQAPGLRLERSLFRWLGLLSESVQLNLWRDDGRIWIAQRALSKAIDPGLWDAAVAGGLPAGESTRQAVFRESLEEAGLTESWHRHIQPATPGPCLRVSRLVSAPLASNQNAHWPGVCLHHERVWRFEMVIPSQWQPSAVDGEVMAFQAVQPEAIFAMWQAGEFNYEAACASLVS